MRISIKKEQIVVFILLAALLIPAVSFAQPAGSSGGYDGSSGSYNGSSGGYNGSSGTNNQVKLDNPLGNITGFCGFIKMLFVTIGTIAVPIAVLFLVYAGFKFVWARGNPTGLEEAKKNIFYTILGIAIFFAAWLLALAIGNTLASFGVSVIGNC